MSIPSTPEGPIQCHQEEKEDDLILAAKLGQTLLKQNEELTNENSKLLRSIEVLQQENFVLKRDLQVMGECNNSLIDDLKSEISLLQESLNKKQPIGEEHSALEKELKDQNQRLTRQLSEAGDKEKELMRTLQNLRDKVNIKRNNLEDHFAYIETLKGEITLTLDKKGELEKHVRDLINEKESLADSLEFSVGKIFSLEKRLQDNEQTIRVKEKELEELYSSNQLLLEKMENWSFSKSSSQSCATSILSELESSSSENNNSHTYKSKHIHIISEEDECLEELEEDTIKVEDYLSDFQSEAIEAYHKIRNICEQTQDFNPESKFTFGESLQWLPLVENLERVLLGSNSKTASTQTIYEEKDAYNEHNQQKKDELETLRIKSKELDRDLSRKDLIIDGISDKLTVLQNRLTQLENSRQMSEKSYQRKIREYGEKWQVEERKRKEPDKVNATEPISSLVEAKTPKINFYQKMESLELQVKDILASKDDTQRRKTNQSKPRLKQNHK